MLRGLSGVRGEGRRALRGGMASSGALRSSLPVAQHGCAEPDGRVAAAVASARAVEGDFGPIPFAGNDRDRPAPPAVFIADVSWVDVVGDEEFGGAHSALLFLRPHAQGERAVMMGRTGVPSGRRESAARGGDGGNTGGGRARLREQDGAGGGVVGCEYNSWRLAKASEWSTTRSVEVRTASTRHVSALSVQPAFSAVPRRTYTRSDCGDAQRQMSCMFSSGQPAARSAQASPTRSECHE
eukprot:6199434-Pleurochrysis_carterae.AAC.1